MIINPLKQKLNEGLPILGFLLSMPSLPVVQVIARTGVDFLMIDLEHGAIGIETAAAMIGATSGTNATPIVRVASPHSDLVKPTLDNGAYGIVFPQISTREEAEATVRVTRYRPIGQRGYGPTYAALRWGISPMEYLRDANDSILNIILVESETAIDALNDILQVDGIDVVVIARGDLTESVGLARQFDHPRILELVARAEAAVASRGRIALGGVAYGADDAKRMIGRGYRFVVLGSDSALLTTSASHLVKSVRL